MLDFALRHRFYIVALNHLTPFPSTPLYERLHAEGRLLYERWWLYSDYRYGMVPFAPRGMAAEQVRQRCVEARAQFYNARSIIHRSLDFQVNSNNFFRFFLVNSMMRQEVMQRQHFPLGDEAFRGELLKVAQAEQPRVAQQPMFINVQWQQLRVIKPHPPLMNNKH